MTARWEMMKVEGKDVRCYVGMPDHDRPRAGVVVAHHASGQDEPMLDTVHRLNRAGYAAVLPDLFHRQPAGLQNTGRVGLLRDPEVVTDMNAALALLKSLDPKVGPLGVTGFCMGGRVTFLMAASNRELKAAALFYGGMMFKPWGEGNPTPFERCADVGCPVMGFFGSEDTNPSPADVAKLDAELTRLGKWHEFHSYQDAGHAFMNFANAERYRHRPSQSAWPQLVAFFDHFLV